MTIGTVIGEIYSTVNHPFYDGRKLLIVQKGRTTSDYIVAVDSVGAGVGQAVLVLDEGNGARQVMESSDGPVRSVIVGIIDCIDDMAGTRKNQKASTQNSSPHQKTPH